MHIDRDLLPDARRIAGEAKEIFTLQCFEHEEIRKGVDHIVNALASPSKTKLASAVQKARSLVRALANNPDLQRSVGWLGDRIERELPQKKPKRHYR